LPEPCRECEWKEVCQGGCASRRLLKGKAEPDEYCFIIRHDKPQINARWRESKGLVHEDYLCTMIFTG
ncbi:radical SAM protein, partial [bacterium]|nr:radical SAM protein [bacterium]